MEIEIHICDVGVERRRDWLESFDRDFHPEHGRVLGKFISYRDDATLVWMHGFDDRSERMTSHEKAPASISETIHNLAPAIGSTITSLDQFDRVNDPVLELRQYRIAPGMRARFATFLRDRTLEPQTRLGMNVYGPFDDLEDENVLTWFRGFPDLVARDRRKASFYQSELWLKELESDAFSMIEDYSNVMLVAPV